MGLFSSLKIAKRSLTRRKTKNLSAILAITLGVTLMVGIQITTDTLEKSFLTSLLLREGEVDLSISGYAGSYLSSGDRYIIENIFNNESNKDLVKPLAMMPDLTLSGPTMIGSQFEPDVRMVGIPLDYPEEFGIFYDWFTEEEMNISNYLTGNTNVLIASELAEAMGVNKSTPLPLELNTQFNNYTFTFGPILNETTGLPIINQTSGLPIIGINGTLYQLERVTLNVLGIYDSNRPGIGAAYRGILFSLEDFQNWVYWSVLDPFRTTDLIGSYQITYQTDHLNNEIDETFLEKQVEAIEAAIPEITIGDQTFKIYSVFSSRLLYIQIIGLVFNLMSSFLNVLLVRLWLLFIQDY